MNGRASNRPIHRPRRRVLPLRDIEFSISPDPPAQLLYSESWRSREVASLFAAVSLPPALRRPSSARTALARERHEALRLPSSENAAAMARRQARLPRLRLQARAVALSSSALCPC